MTDYTKISDLTVGEFRTLMEDCMGTRVEHPKAVSGLKGLADLFGVSVTTAKRLKASGVLNAAISQSGRTIIINADKALELYERATHSRNSNLNKICTH